MPRTCRYCGCSELEPCVDEDGETCMWVAADACSFCADVAEPLAFAAHADDEPRVQLFTEGEANAVIRAMRAGGAL